MNLPRHAAHFRLDSAPFGRSEQPQPFFAEGRHGERVRRIVRIVARTRGIVWLCGRPGSGKAALSRFVAEQLADTRTPAHVSALSLGGSRTLETIAQALDAATERGLDAAELRSRLHDRLRRLADDGRPALLVVRGAQLIDAPSLAQLRALADAAPVSIVLLDPQPAPERARTGSDGNAASEPRIPIPPLAAEDVGAYLDFRMKAAGWKGSPVFSDNAAKTIASLSAGHPDKVNLLADAALALAAEQRAMRVGARDVASAARRLVEQRASARSGWDAYGGSPQGAGGRTPAGLFARMVEAAASLLPFADRTGGNARRAGRGDRTASDDPTPDGDERLVFADVRTVPGSDEARGASGGQRATNDTEITDAPKGTPRSRFDAAA